MKGTLKRVVVTGLGAITPIGNTFNDYWKGLLNGISGAAPISLFDTSQFKTKFACEVKNFEVSDYFDRKEARKLDRNSMFGLIAANEAISHSNLTEYDLLNKLRVGVIWGSGIGGITTFQNEILEYAKTFKPRFSPFFIPKIIPDITPGLISIEHGFHGANYATVSACASSTNAIIDAYHLIQLGKADAIITGGSEAGISESAIGGFNSLKALSTRNDEPKTASRPFDQNREGFVLGEGAGSLVVEELEHAQKRGATIYAEIIGSGMSADAHHITAPHPEGLGAFHVMKNAMDDAGLQTNELDHINMHGTSTPLGDLAESKAIQQLFGEDAYRIQLNSTKSMTGHLLGAAGAIESLAAIGALLNNIVPPTINHFTDDENIDAKLNFTFNQPVKKEITTALSNTFGFGGHNACLLFKKF